MKPCIDQRSAIAYSFLMQHRLKNVLRRRMMMALLMQIKGTMSDVGI